MSNINELYPERAGCITASKAFDVMAKGRGNDLFGAMAKTYAHDIALERLGVIQDNFTTFAMQQGIDREPDAREIYEQSRGVKCELRGFVTHPEYPFIGCTPDGEPLNGLLEIKCPQPKAHIDYLLHGIPPKYYAQVQHQMLVTGKKWCDFMTFNPDFPDKLKAKVYRIGADKDFQTDLLDRCIQLNLLVEEIISAL
jgi:putative phage-type endonuclease